MHQQFRLRDMGLRSCLLFDSVIRISENECNSEILFSACKAVKRVGSPFNAKFGFEYKPSTT